MMIIKVFSCLLFLLFVLLFGVFGAQYVPGTPGGPWTDGEVTIVRQKVMQMLNASNYAIKNNQTGTPYGPNEYNTYGDFLKEGLDENAYHGCSKDDCAPSVSGISFGKSSRRPNAAKLLRLAFHDCVRNIDDNGLHFGGCDGCLNWEGMGFKMPEALSKRKKPFKYTIPTHGDNNALQYTVKLLELIYTNASWPVNSPKLNESLRDSGKSRADLWQLAANVALEQEIVRANFACDFHPAHQQSTALEGRDSCLIKLHKPISWQYGRADCVREQGKNLTNLPYESTNKETGYNAHGTGQKVLETLKEDFGFTAEEGISLMAVHATNGQTRNKMQSTKYKWIGYYLGNMYYKILSGAPLYENVDGLGFSIGKGKLRAFYLRGDKDGNPMNGTRMIPHFHKLWKKDSLNPDGGPIHFRPTGAGCADMEHFYKPRLECIEGFDESGTLRVDKTNPNCAGMEFDDKNAVLGGIMDHHHPCYKAFSFAFTYEVSFVYNFTVNEANYPGGCHPFEESLVNIWNRPLETQYVQCPPTDFAPEGKSTSQIMMDFALDNKLWQQTFLETWQKMQANGYENLKDGPKSSWLGYSFLEMQGFDHLEFPLLFTNNTRADPVENNKWTTFSEMCRMFANEGLDPYPESKHNSIWESPTENGRQNGYTPCPPELMKDHNDTN